MPGPPGRGFTPTQWAWLGEQVQKNNMGALPSTKPREGVVLASQMVKHRHEGDWGLEGQAEQSGGLGLRKHPESGAPGKERPRRELEGKGNP